MEIAAANKGAVYVVKRKDRGGARFESHVSSLPLRTELRVQRYYQRCNHGDDDPSKKRGGKNLLGGSFSSRTRVDTRSSNNFDGKISFTMLLFEDDQKRIQEFVDILKGREKMLEN